MYYQITGTSKHFGNIDIISKKIPWGIVEKFDKIIILESEQKYGFNYPFNCRVVCNKNRYCGRDTFPENLPNNEYIFEIDDEGITNVIYNSTDIKSVDEIIEYVKNKYPVGLTWQGHLTEEDYSKLEECCEVHCVQPHIDGSGTYHFRYKKN